MFLVGIPRWTDYDDCQKNNNDVIETIIVVPRTVVRTAVQITNLISKSKSDARFSSMASKSDLPDLTGQWLCCRQEEMDKLIEASSSGVKGWVAKNAAWATGYGVGKTTMNVDQDGQ